MIHGGRPTVYVADMNTAVTFYTDTLGLKLRARYGDHWAEVDAGDGLVIGLHPSGPHSPQPGTGGATQLGFSVNEPLDGVVAELSKRGVKFHGPIIDDAKGGIRLAFFADMDGNPLYLCESKWP